MNFILKIFLYLLLFYSSKVIGQVGGIVNGNGNSSSIVFVQKDEEDPSKEFERIAPKMYYSQTYLSCKVDDFNEDIPLRYNIYKDEMEFVNKDKVLFLKKELGRKIHFKNLNIDYAVFNYHGKLTYFQVLNSNGVMLLCKQNIEYQKPKKSENSYQSDKLADFIKKDDTFF